MPPIAPTYEWTQDAAAITLSIPLKGTKAALVDLFAASTYVKVSFGRYLLELDLLRPIDDRAVTAAARQGVLTVTLPKQDGDPWPSLTLEENKEDKQAVRERRAAAVAEQRATEQWRAETERGRRAELKQAAFRAQMAVQERARRAAEARATQEKREAEGAILGVGAAAAAAPTPLPMPPLPKPAASSVPPPRVMRQATVRVQFTPRAFPTPARESKAAEEEDWLARNRPGSTASVLQEEKGGGGCEAHPVFLKAKGDELFKAGDFAGAINAYGACLAADPTHGGALANRAACHLKLGHWDDCVVDCTRALGLLPPPEGSSCSDNKARVRLLARRGSAYFEQGLYVEALEDYRAASRASPAGERDEALVHDVAKLEGLVGAAGAAAAGGNGGQEQ